RVSAGGAAVATAPQRIGRVAGPPAWLLQPSMLLGLFPPTASSSSSAPRSSGPRGPRPPSGGDALVAFGSESGRRKRAASASRRVAGRYYQTRLLVFGYLALDLR